MRNRRIAIALTVFMLMGYTAQGTWGPYVGLEQEYEYFIADGVKLHYCEEGNPNGEAVIFLHGFTMNLESGWRRTGVTEELSADYRVVTLDHRGHGFSAKPYATDKYGVEMAHDIVRLMDHLGIERAHLVGNSLGSLIAIKTLELYPGRVQSLVGCGMGLARYEGESKQASIDLIESLENGGGFEPLIRYLQPQDDPLSWVELSTGNTIVKMFNDERALLEVARSLPELQAEPAALRAIGTPVLTVVGSRDPLLRDVDALHDSLPNHQTLVVEGATHFDLTDFDDCRQSIVGFIAQHKLEPVPSMS